MVQVFTRPIGIGHDFRARVLAELFNHAGGVAESVHLQRIGLLLRKKHDVGGLLLRQFKIHALAVGRTHFACVHVLDAVVHVTAYIDAAAHVGNGCFIRV